MRELRTSGNASWKPGTPKRAPWRCRSQVNVQRACFSACTNSLAQRAHRKKVNLLGLLLKKDQHVKTKRVRQVGFGQVSHGTHGHISILGALQPFRVVVCLEAFPDPPNSIFPMSSKRFGCGFCGSTQDIERELQNPEKKNQQGDSGGEHMKSTKSASKPFSR